MSAQGDRYKTVKLFVQSGTFSKSVLQYVSDNIDEINREGIKIKIVKIIKDDSNHKKLQSAGLSPPLLDIQERSSPIVGKNNIIKFFESLSVSKAAPRKKKQSDVNFRDYAASQMFEGMDDDGNYIPRKDDDDNETNQRDKDYRQRAAELEKRRTQRNKNSLSGDEIEDRARRKPSGKHPGRRVAEQPDDEPNVPEYDDEPVVRRRPGESPDGVEGGDTLDNQILNALISD